MFQTTNQQVMRSFGMLQYRLIQAVISDHADPGDDNIWALPTPPCKSSKMDSVIQLLPFQPGSNIWMFKEKKTVQPGFKSW